MRKPTELKSPVGRFLGAFLGFITIIGFGVYYLTLDNELAPTSKQSKTAQSQNSKEKPDTLFYKRLGTSPIVNSEGTKKSTQTGPGDGYTLEIKVTETRSEAEQLIDTLREKGIDAYYTPIAVKGRVQYRVRFGIYNDAANAQAESKKIIQAHNVSNKVIKLR
jgi:hypothetical protein